MWGDWKVYSREEQDSMAADARPFTDPSERMCPVCRRRCVRWYSYDLTSGGIGILYVWCYDCKRYIASRGLSRTAKYDIDDPIAGSAERLAIRRKEGARFLELLQELWNSGELPQTFVPKKA